MEKIQPKLQSIIKLAIQLSNSTAFGLSSGIVTNNMTHAIRFVKELKVGTVNINEVPGYRIEN
ncbi:aldehyde dehydrogenase family protein [Mucilaginibacter sp.]|uniref:aldehyde dehydrogenase family protein n=1 Tax=Mucilaginibacter sp. TaxID=1882438 RepID=UPI0025EA644A|nr:aldehyde dehydrogenase family protein [Mucilaginibacter sp.]